MAAGLLITRYLLHFKDSQDLSTNSRQLAAGARAAADQLEANQLAAGLFDYPSRGGLGPGELTASRKLLAPAIEPRVYPQACCKQPATYSSEAFFLLYFDIPSVFTVPMIATCSPKRL